MNKFDAVIALLKRGWTKGVTARDAEGKPVVSWDPNAVCWCVLGAISLVTSGMQEPLETVEKIRPFIDEVYLSEWNDNCQSVDEVIAVLERARDS